MNWKQEWMITFLLALTLSLCLFIVVDIAYDERIWEFGAFTLKARIQAIGVTIGAFCLGSYVFRRIARSFIRKSKNEKKATWKEYALVLLLNLLLLNSIHTFILCFITGMQFRWRESLLVNVAGSVLLFLYYTMIRNGILFESFMEQNLQLEKVKVNQLETELKFLKSQYHPHFLFNALNTIYFQVEEDNREAKQSIEHLAELLRYQLYTIEKEVTMEQEINYLKSYIAFQQSRTSKRLVLDLYFDPALKTQKVPPLLFQPLMENAFKYVRGAYRIKVEMKCSGNRLQARIENSISPVSAASLASPASLAPKEKGIGLENLRRRLDLLYPHKYNLSGRQTEDKYIATLTITLD